MLLVLERDQQIKLEGLGKTNLREGAIDNVCVSMLHGDQKQQQLFVVVGSFFSLLRLCQNVESLIIWGPLALLPFAGLQSV